MVRQKFAGAAFMDNVIETIVKRISASGRVTPQDVATLRPIVWNNGEIGPDEADAVFAINDACYAKCPEWRDFFVEAGTVYLVEQAAPKGYIDDAKAAWLMERIDRDGKVDGSAELELIVKTLEAALNAPDSLKAYALTQIERVVLTGEGPTRVGAVLRPGTIEEAEVALLRRLFFARGSDRSSLISDAEANALFRIKQATRGAENAPSWPQLFVQMIGNHIMAHQSYAQLPIERARALERFMDDNLPRIGGFLARMEAAISDPASLHDAFATAAGGDDGTAVVADRAMTTAEAHWLKLHIAADGELDTLERALLAFIIDESGPMPAEMTDYVEAKRA
jgi:tellurite resistance protein